MLNVLHLVAVVQGQEYVTLPIVLGQLGTLTTTCTTLTASITVSHMMVWILMMIQSICDTTIKFIKIRLESIHRNIKDSLMNGYLSLVDKDSTHV